MAKKKQSQTLVTPSAAKKSSEVASTSKKPLGVTSPVKKQSGVTSPVKKPSEAASLAKKPLEVVASTSKKPLKETSTTAKKMQPEPVKNPPPESSSDSEEESDSSSEEEDESSKDFGKKTASAPVVTNENSDSKLESETESVSYSKTEPTTKTPTTDAVVVSSPNKKRQSEGEPSTEVKRAKTETETETAKKPPFQRLWSEEDEIVLLQGMIDFSSDTDHDKKCFELANMIWGSDVDATLVKSTKKIKVDDSLKVDVVNVECDWFERSFIVGAFKNLGAGVDEETLKEKWYLVPVRTRKMIEEKIKSVQANEIKLVLQKLDVLHEVSSMMANSD
ncbi:hypothetical protein ARALYDRAFT_892497 [Arabidopsis lyrata subsp. lyrata]|uniref:Uncharacterized protein n=1 Tax=Arabidopsis lyrata subsp. lyrata TaxID=81972 RepID=D7KM55_ARALL|nr:hypothetical protein ARALYDRAFT_892497 [Arabidopsis lyrata subsp. lyrata]